MGGEPVLVESNSNYEVFRCRYTTDDDDLEQRSRDGIPLFEVENVNTLRL